ncbi:molybdenum ABC transporter ATP-binding protein [Pedobacter quisquiliarum]|uniref:Molybdenum ABC transporter ATP-binding protein n=1 Tax=Pedobacter quisquiliarum TaxID=1834438 RepID=A0A916TYX6_9SPHI|nr:ATP-binding cassette domain-containing protein [Pedobacter quisquiliarum]GGC51713.1 molybdenum ABC transporter ATP-binding protein [Pedobacter quisquiliarum]
MEVFVRIEHFSIKIRNQTILSDLSWQIVKGEHWLLNGPSGSGKTLLAKALAERATLNGIQTLFVPQWFTFKDKQGASNFYFQQRFNSADAENTVTVWETILEYLNRIQQAVDNAETLLKTFKLAERKHAPIIQLSSGEHKKVQLLKALLYRPKLLILDNPYTGLDVQTRASLNEQLDLGCGAGMQLLIVSNDAVVPRCINRFASIMDGKIVTSETAFQAKDQAPTYFKLPAFLAAAPVLPLEELVALQNVNIRYGDKQILKDLNWSLKPGERWLLKGHNGSGKSTLISLLTGDNPQAYAQELYLFGKKRGTGESIWDIKKQIGFISPELQWYFEPGSTVFQAVASGLFDTSGLFRQLSPQQTDRTHQLLTLFGLQAEANDLLVQLPIGKQRLALLARAIIKNPPLLILDEPCQGLDEAQTRMFNQLVGLLCTANRSLIYVSHLEHTLPDFLTHELILRNGRVIRNKPILEQEYTA